MNTVDLLERLVLKVPCASCGASYDVPVQHVLESQQLVRDFERMWDEGCPNYCRESVCELVQYAALVDEGAARDVERRVAGALERLAGSGLDVSVSCAIS
ncbi:MAG TPA: hypothetical protein VG871_16675 [Vicinamibacterales bacterium]|nr:hypothetical protein [Vicinamibacterales bacterium]